MHCLSEFFQLDDTTRVLHVFESPTRSFSIFDQGDELFYTYRLGAT